MILTYSENSSLMTAVEDTFSGEKPCGKCHQIKKLKYEDDGSQLNSAVPIPFLLDPVLIPLTDSQSAFFQTSGLKFEWPGHTFARSFRMTPATPPPDLTLSS